MEEERDLVTFVDEDGNEFDLEVIDYFEHNDKEYGVLIDPETPDDAEYFEVCIMEIVQNEEEELEEFLPVEDEALQAELLKIAEERMQAWDDELEDIGPVEEGGKQYKQAVKKEFRNRNFHSASLRYRCAVAHSPRVAIS